MIRSCGSPHYETGQTRQREPCQVDLILEGGESLFHVMDAEKQKSKPRQGIANAAQLP